MPHPVRLQYHVSHPLRHNQERIHWHDGLLYRLWPIAVSLLPSGRSRYARNSPKMATFAQHFSYAFIPDVNVSSPGIPSSTDTSRDLLQPCDASLTTKNTSSWTYCGPLLPPDAATLPPSFHSWASVTVSKPGELSRRLLSLLSALRLLLHDASVGHYWLTIRASRPTHEYDTPRWHVDDNFFAPGFGRLMRDDNAGGSIDAKIGGWKIAATLLGPSTLFLKDNAPALEVLRETKAQEGASHQHECTLIRCLGCSTYLDSVRQSLASSLKSHAIVSPQPNELAFFRIGDSEGAVHSEPRCNVDRIFVNIVPGTEEQLSILMRRWGMQYPRAWCLGVPGRLMPSDESDWYAKRA